MFGYTQYNYIDNSVDISSFFDTLPITFQEEIKAAEDADQAGLLGEYLCLADAIYIDAKNLYADNRLSRRYWELLGMRYTEAL